MIEHWDDLKYWSSEDWRLVQEWLDHLDKKHTLYNPKRELLFAALDATPFDKVKVVIYGQDPYPNRGLCSGLAFSIPNGMVAKGLSCPPTLDSIFNEYCRDLHHPYPDVTDLITWANRGVLLWNTIPSCLTGLSMSHDWPEWASLTKEITQELSNKGDIVFVFMGAVARRNVQYVSKEHNTVLETAHPVVFSRFPNRTVSLSFRNSRIFSTINDKLTKVHRTDPINWRL